MVPTGRISRRGVLGACLGAGSALVVGAGLRGGYGQFVRAQTTIDATPPAPPSAISEAVSYGPTIASKAAELGYDLDRITLFVSEEIRYEPYAGALRGASATLWGLAGNAVDQALLLSALLTEAQITWRFAAGALDDATANALVEQANASIAKVADGWVAASNASLAPTGELSVATPVPEAAATPAPDDPLVADIGARAAFAATTGEQSFTSLAGQIAKALDDAHVAIAPAGITALPDLERSRHVWVQVADGPRWSSIAPALSGAGSAKVPDPAETFATIPDDLIHTIAVRLSVETLSGAYLLPSDVATATMSAAEAARSPIEIGVSPPQSMAAAGFAINEALAGTSALVPYLASGEAVLQAASSPIPFAIGGGALDVLGAATPACCQDGELVSLSYTVDVTAPGAQPVTIQRYLLDRLTPAARANAAAGVDATAILPLNLAKLSDGTTMPEELTSTTFLTVVTGAIPMTYGVFAPSADPAMKGISLIGASQAGLAASFARQRLLAATVHALVATPQLSAFTVGTTSADAESTLLVQGDLLHQQQSLLASKDGVTVSGLHPLIVAGIVNQVAEDVAIAPAFLSGDAKAPLVAGQSVGTVFAAASAQGIGIHAITATAGTVPAGLAEDVSALIQQALTAGKVVVAPERAVKLASGSGFGWWEIDPATGDTRDVYANGKGYAASQGPAVAVLAQDAVEEAEILKTVNSWRPWYQRLGRCVGAAAMIGGMAVAAEGAVGVALGGNAATAAGKVVMANPNILKDVKNLIKGC
ncbi:MAG: hypothetical protein WBA46_14150 [Thermomicrobiales bacterium]